MDSTKHENVIIEARICKPEARKFNFVADVASGGLNHVSKSMTCNKSYSDNNEKTMYAYYRSITLVVRICSNRSNYIDLFRHFGFEVRCREDEPTRRLRK